MRKLTGLWFLLTFVAGCSQRMNAPADLPFADDFDRETLGTQWSSAGGGWKIEDNAVFNDGARNVPLWLNFALPKDVRISFDAESRSPDVDIKFEVFGDGKTHQSGYVVILGGWKNTKNIIARLDEHGEVRAPDTTRRLMKQVRANREKAMTEHAARRDVIERAQPFEPNKTYRFVFERKGNLIRWFVDGALQIEYFDPSPLHGPGHDRFAFSNWASQVRFDNLRIERMGRLTPREPPDIKQKSQVLAQKLIIVDGHVDLPHRLYSGLGKDGKISEDVSLLTKKGDFDFIRAKTGGLTAPFMSIYIPSSYQKDGGAKKMADTLIDMVEGLARSHPDKFVLATTPAQVRGAHKRGLVALPMGIENGAAIEGDLANVSYFALRGVRYITLTHAKDNKICDSSYAETRTHKGLSKFGEKVVAEMNRTGIMVDISHVSDDAFYDVMKIAKAPVIASHSSLRHFVPGFERNMTDEMVKKVAENNGVVMINFGSTFVRKDSNEIGSKRWKLRDAFLKEKNIKKDDFHDHRDAFSAYADAKVGPMIFAKVTDVADHIDRVKELVGVEHVGLGSDFDGVGDTLPEGLKDASMLPNLIEELLRRGYLTSEIGKITSGNILRVWQAVLDKSEALKHPRTAEAK